jgi:hypothetical protein
MSPACSRSVSSEPLPPLMKSPRSLRLTLSTICGRSWLKSRTASLIACATTRTTAPKTIAIASTSTIEHSLRLQRSRRSIALTTGTSTAALKIETKITSRTFAIDTSAHAMATAPATRRIVGIEIEISTRARPAAVAREEGSPVLISVRRLADAWVSRRHAFQVIATRASNY